MPRIARLVVTDCPYHLTHRGNHKEAVFFEDATRRDYLRLLEHYSRRYRLDIWAYCLMPNHVHLVVVARRKESMARAIGNAHREYSRSVNRQRGWTGHLWANRFFSTPMDQEHLWNAVRYVESNPSRARLVGRCVDYPWSSARAHAGLVRDGLLAAGRPFPGALGNRWADWVDLGTRRPEYERLRRRTSTGRPCGSPEFVERIERETGRKVPRERPTRKTRS